MKFTKMHGIGNDYVYVSTFDQPAPADPSRLAVAISDRHFGVGSDGLILIEPVAIGRRPDADVQRRRLGVGDVRQRRPLRRQVHPRPRDRPQARVTDRDRPGRPDARPRGRGRQGPPGPGRHGAADPPGVRHPDDPPRRPAGRRPADGRGARPEGHGRLDGQPARGRLRRRRGGFPVEAVGAGAGAAPGFPRRVNAHFVQVISPGRGPDADLGARLGDHPGLRHRRLRRGRRGGPDRPDRPRDPRPPPRRRPRTRLGRPTTPPSS